jgi:protein-S-isoprenylcysteine O-methyltransferase Ste14
MVEQFGDEYREYQRRVPMFIPRREGAHLQEAE